MRVWYLVRDFDLGRDFYKRVLSFDETFVDFDDRWATLSRGTMHIARSSSSLPNSGKSTKRLISTINCCVRRMTRPTKVCAVALPLRRVGQVASIGSMSSRAASNAGGSR